MDDGPLPALLASTQPSRSLGRATPFRAKSHCIKAILLAIDLSPVTTARGNDKTRCEDRVSQTQFPMKESKKTKKVKNTKSKTHFSTPRTKSPQIPCQFPIPCFPPFERPGSPVCGHQAISCSSQGLLQQGSANFFSRFLFLFFSSGSPSLLNQRRIFSQPLNLA